MIPRRIPNHGRSRLTRSCISKAICWSRSATTTKRTFSTCLANRNCFSAALAAHVAETSAPSAVADILELDFDSVGRVNQDLDSLALPHPRPSVGEFERVALAAVFSIALAKPKSSTLT